MNPPEIKGGCTREIEVVYILGLSFFEILEEGLSFGGPCIS